MNLTMHQPISYPFYMSSPRLPYSVPWSPNPYRFPSPSPQQQHHFPSPSPQQQHQHFPSSYPLPFILSPQQQIQQQQQPPPPPRLNNPSLKSLHSFSSYTNTRYNHLKQSTSHINRYRSIDPSLHYPIPPNHQYRPSKTNSVSDLQQLFHPPLPKAHSWHSMGNLYPPNFNTNNYSNEIHSIPQHHHHHRGQHKKKSHKKYISSPKQKQSMEIPPNPGLVRISTLDEIPIITNPIYKTNPKNINRKNFTKQSSSSSSSSIISQQRLNGSLRNDPLLMAAMEDFRQLQRTSSQSTPLTPHNRDLSRDSLCSDSTHHSSSPPISRIHSHSSFTSLERLEIRHLIKTLKTKDIQTLNIPFQLSPSSIEQSITKQPTLNPIIKPKKTSITEELDREFNKLRSINPDNDLVYVKPSLITKQKHPLSSSTISDNQNIDISKLKELDEKTYENPILSISVQQSSPSIPSTEEKTKPEYAIPIKKLPMAEVNLRPTKKDEPLRSFSFCKPMNDIVNETYQTRPLSMFNWLHCGLTNPFPTTTFQPNRISNNEVNYDKSLVKENIYASDIDIHIPLANNDEKDYLNNQTIMTDYLSDYKQTNSSILNDFSRLFTRKHEQKSKLKSKLHKNNNNNNNLRCSIM